MAKNKIRIAVAGCGRQADLAYLPWISENPAMELVAVADSNEELALRAQKKHGAKKTFANWRDMLDGADIDALMIATPPWVHAEPSIAAAERGIHVLCEKPMASTSAECRAMADAAEKGKTVLQIGFSLRFDPGFEKIKCMLKKNEIGRIFQLRSTYDGWVPDLEKPLFKEAYELIDKMGLFPPGLGRWRMMDGRTGGVYNDHSIHYVDMFSWFMEERITHVSGISQHVVQSRLNEDHASSLLRFESGAAAYVQSSLSRFSARGSKDEGLLHGESGCIKYLMDQSWYITGFPHLNNAHCRVWKFGLPSFVVNEFLPVPVKSGRSQCMFKRQFDWFISRIDGTFRPHPVIGDGWAATPADGVRAVRVVEAFYESSENCAQVEIDD